ncbi:MAG: DcaP family trimeric outer membrane transporter [Acidithiobacillales bacterium]
MTISGLRKTAILIAAVSLCTGGSARAQSEAETKEAKPSGLRGEIYGFAQADFIYDFNQVNPDWFDVLRTTKLPSFDNEFGHDGHFWASVRQTRFGVKGWIPTGLGEIKTIFEFELFGVGVDAGQTTIRLRHAWGELRAVGAGQTWSPFMDPDIFPNQLEYWGPTGMPLFRNVQVRWMPLRGEDELYIALERPGASADGGVYSDRIELQDVKARFPLPDLSAHYRLNRTWGHVQLSGIVRYIKWDDLNPDPFDLSGNATGWGLHVSTNLKPGKNDVIRASVVYGEGIENYMNDAPIDIGIKNNFGDPTKPVVGKPLPVLGVVAFLDHNWSPKFSTAVGYSYEHIDNTDGQKPSDFAWSHYALANLLYTPVPAMMAGMEFQWGQRHNFADGFSVDDFRIQFSFKYNFSFKLGGKS